MNFCVKKYTPPFLLFHAHLETIYPALLRNVSLKPYERERITTPDQDFLDLDWLRQGSKQLVIISHGLEGNTSRAYIRGMAKTFFQTGYDVLTWNYRGCSGELNRNVRFYHSGATEDLETVVQHAIQKDAYEEISLVGFSLGGNLTLKYLGENKNQLPFSLKKAVVFSVPMDLHSSCLQISSPSNWVYSKRFLNSLKDKVIQKSKIFPELNTEGIDSITSLKEFDDKYTAPIHGFKNALDYYTQNSSIHFIKGIEIPTLIVSAKNDPFLSTECFPSHDEIQNSNLTIEYPNFGGHVGFTLFSQNGVYWSELRALEFIQTKR
ncbi:MAG: alpha/beta fold hydrolase [Bacteroidia bacterium]|nr:alpha/beta fold hydrolase [Bacteroidia bacterium]